MYKASKSGVLPSIMPDKRGASPHAFLEESPTILPPLFLIIAPPSFEAKEGIRNKMFVFLDHSHTKVDDLVKSQIEIR